MSYSKCSGICKKYKSIGSPLYGRYKKGHKRCTSCGVFIIYEGDRCPCCNTKLRVTPKDKKLKEEFNDAKGVNKRID